MQTGSLFWSEQDSILYVGFDDGKITQLRVTDNAFEEVSEVELHKNRVTGMLVNEGRMHSICDSGRLRVSNAKTGEELDEILPSHPYVFSLKTIIDLPGRNAYCITDNLGQFHLYTKDTSEPIIKTEGVSKDEIRGVCCQH